MLVMFESKVPSFFNGPCHCPSYDGTTPLDSTICAMHVQIMSSAPEKSPSSNTQSNQPVTQYQCTDIYIQFYCTMTHSSQHLC